MKILLPHQSTVLQCRSTTDPVQYVERKRGKESERERGVEKARKEMDAGSSRVRWRERE